MDVRGFESDAADTMRSLKKPRGATGSEDSVQVSEDDTEASFTKLQRVMADLSALDSKLQSKGDKGGSASASPRGSAASGQGQGVRPAAHPDTPRAACLVIIHNPISKLQCTT